MSTEGLNTVNSPTRDRRDASNGVVVRGIAGRNDNHILGLSEQPAHRNKRLGLERGPLLDRLPGVVTNNVPPFDNDEDS